MYIPAGQTTDRALLFFLFTTSFDLFYSAAHQATMAGTAKGVWDSSNPASLDISDLAATDLPLHAPQLLLLFCWQPPTQCFRHILSWTPVLSLMLLRDRGEALCMLGAGGAP